jgi:hypothetical protein
LWDISPEDGTGMDGDHPKAQYGPGMMLNGQQRCDTRLLRNSSCSEFVSDAQKPSISLFFYPANDSLVTLLLRKLWIAFGEVDEKQADNATKGTLLHL